MEEKRCVEFLRVIDYPMKERSKWCFKYLNLLHSERTLVAPKMLCVPKQDSKI